MYAVNRPMALAARGVTAKAFISVVPSGPGATLGTPPSKVTNSVNGGTILTPQPALLVVSDCADLASASADNMIFSAPLASLVAGTTVDLGVTSTGLTISSMPPGVAIAVDYQ
jgi:hypothetical protein